MEDIILEDHYELQKRLGGGRYGSVHLALDKKTDAHVAIKVFPRNTKDVKQADFMREYKTSRYLMSHPNIIATNEGAYRIPSAYFFIQELSYCGSLREIIVESKTGLSAHNVKKVLRQLISAVGFLHDEDLVHCNIQAKNILIFDNNLELIKLTDFGLTRKEGSVVQNFDSVNPYHAPELCDTMQKETYTVDTAIDVWAIGILIFFCLRAKYPWEMAKFSMPAFWAWREYVNRRSANVPLQFQNHSEKMLKFFIRTLNPKPEDRYSIKDMKKYLNVVWFKEDQSSDFFLSGEPSHAMKPSSSHPCVSSIATDKRNSTAKSRSKLTSWLMKRFSTS